MKTNHRKGSGTYSNEQEAREKLAFLRPNFVIRWGFVTFMLFFGALVFYCSLVKYPELLTLKVTDIQTRDNEVDVRVSFKGNDGKSWSLQHEKKLDLLIRKKGSEKIMTGLVLSVRPEADSAIYIVLKLSPTDIEEVSESDKHADLKILFKRDATLLERIFFNKNL